MENSIKLSLVLIGIIFVLLFSNIYLFKSYKSLEEQTKLKDNKSINDLNYSINKKNIIIKNEFKRLATKSN